jgi:hypothetical protein
MSGQGLNRRGTRIRDRSATVAQAARCASLVGGAEMLVPRRKQVTVTVPDIAVRRTAQIAPGSSVLGAER